MVKPILMTSLPRAIPAALALSLATPLTAQTAPQNIPSLDNYSLPAEPATAVPIPPAPVIILPTPVPIPTPAPTPQPKPTTRATPRIAAVPEATPTLDTTPSSTAAAAPVATPTPTATPIPPPAPVVAAGGQGSSPLGWIAAAVAAIAAVAFVLLRRRREALDAVDSPDVAVAPGMYSPTAPRIPRAMIDLSLRPIRAGLNMLSATVEAELTVVNTGDALATDIRIALALFSAHAGQDAELTDHLAQPILRPAVPPFALAPGETRTARIVVALPRTQIIPMTAANRPMFVPIVAANCLYDTAAIAAQTAQRFAIGIQRVDSPKLAPFWLDIPAKMQDQVAARPHAPALIR